MNQFFFLFFFPAFVLQENSGLLPKKEKKNSASSPGPAVTIAAVKDKSHDVQSCQSTCGRVLESPALVLLPRSHTAFFQGISRSRKPLPSKPQFSS